MSLIEQIEGKYILCLCEGNAEMEILEMLLESNLLVFSKQDLINETLCRRESVSVIQEKYLGFEYDREVVILRIIDSRCEKFRLSKLYADRFKDLMICTNPEIEILIIIDHDDYRDFTKHKDKPSIYCKHKYGYRDIKKKGFMKHYFSDDNRLLHALQRHKKICGVNHFTIFDLVRFK